MDFLILIKSGYLCLWSKKLCAYPMSKSLSMSIMSFLKIKEKESAVNTPCLVLHALDALLAFVLFLTTSAMASSSSTTSCLVRIRCSTLAASDANSHFMRI